MLREKAQRRRSAEGGSGRLHRIASDRLRVCAEPWWNADSAFGPATMEQRFEDHPAGPFDTSRSRVSLPRRPIFATWSRQVLLIWSVRAGHGGRASIQPAWEEFRREGVSGLNVPKRGCRRSRRVPAREAVLSRLPFAGCEMPLGGIATAPGPLVEPRFSRQCNVSRSRGRL